MLVASVLMSGMALGGSSEKVVRGYVRDTDGRPMESVSVTVNIRLASDDSIRTTLTELTDETGFYSLTFGPFDWDLGDRIEVIATHGSNQESESVVANSDVIQYVDITFPYAIPEFGSVVGFVIAGGLIAAVAMVFLVSKRKK